MTQAAEPLPDLDAIWNPGEPEEGEIKLAEALRAGERAQDVGYQAEAIALIARTHSLRRQFEQAHATLDRAQAMLGAEMPAAHIRYLLERGRTFNSEGEQHRARPLFVEAFERAKQAREDRLAVDAAHMVAIADIKAPASALEWNLIALDYAEQSDQEGAKGWLGSLYNNIGWTYFDRSQYEEALEMQQKGLRFRQAKGEPAPIRIAHWAVARTLRALGRVEEALAMQLQIRERFEPTLGPSGFNYEELGECHLALGKPGHGPLFAKAHALLSQDSWFAKEEAARLQRIEQLSTE